MTLLDITDLPDEKAATHTRMSLTWCIGNTLSLDEESEESEESEEEIESSPNMT